MLSNGKAVFTEITYPNFLQKKQMSLL